jgi:hypothetical protein
VLGLTGRRSHDGDGRMALIRRVVFSHPNITVVVSTVSRATVINVRRQEYGRSRLWLAHHLS